jgi:hypothetical protein
MLIVRQAGMLLMHKLLIRHNFHCSLFRTREKLLYGMVAAQSGTVHMHVHLAL